MTVQADSTSGCSVGPPWPASPKPRPLVHGRRARGPRSYEDRLDNHTPNLSCAGTQAGRRLIAAEWSHRYDAAAMRVLLVQLCEIEGPGRLEACLDRREVEHTIHRSYEDAPAPPLERFGAVVILGTPASCRDIEARPDLLRVRDLVAEGVARDQPMLGICFGGQLLAQVLGADVRPNETPEIGAYAARLTDEGAASPLFGGFPREFSVAHWHSDTFALPNGASLLATGMACRNQAFARGRSVGLQFHLELSPAKARDWVSAYADDLPRVDKTGEDVMEELTRHGEEMGRLCDRFVGNFLRTAG